MNDKRRYYSLEIRERAIRMVRDQRTAQLGVGHDRLDYRQDQVQG